MCGLTGFIGSGNLTILKKMTDSLSHRGPDSDGTYQDGQVFLGHRRLAIIDIAGGQQPMADGSGDFVIIFNGEIYNHIELRQQLKKLGHHFNSDHSDTEVLLHGYKQWRQDLPAKLNGMFAFVIYDKKNQTLFMARDRYGQKPLYYAKQGDLFIFGSELTALFQHPSYKKEINLLALKKYFAYGFLPAPHCQYQNTFKLPGGHYLHYDIKNQVYDTKAYWQFNIEIDHRFNERSEADICEELRFLLKQSVRRRLMSDVPVGLFLSGGLDSSSVLAFASELNPEINSFAIGFQEKSYDESVYAKEMADYFQVTHAEKILSIEKSKELINPILTKLNEPLADPSILPTFLVSEFAAKKVKVVLGGDGGDELFAGYDPFKALNLAKWYQTLVPKLCHKGFQSLAQLLPVSAKNMSFDFKIKRLLKGLAYPEHLWHPVWMSPLSEGDISDLFNEKIHAEELYQDAIDAWFNSSADNIYDKSLEYFTRFYLQDDILTKVDRASMMVSLECRAPFLDIDLANFVRKLPYQFKYRHGTTKYILKKAMQPLLPKHIIKRPKKGFGIPLTHWLRDFPNNPPVASIANSNQAFVQNKWQEHRQIKADHKLFLWSWLVADVQFNQGKLC